MPDPPAPEPPVPEPLSAAAAIGLSAARPLARVHRAARWLLFLSGLAILALNVATLPADSCSQATPCLQRPVEMFLSGIMLIVPLLCWWDLGFAVAAAVAMSVGLVGYSQAEPASGAPGWVQLLLLTYAAGCVAVLAEVRRRSRDLGGAQRTAVRLRPPAPAVPILAPVGVAVTATALLVGALATAAYSQHRQASADERQRSAEIITATVSEYLSDTALELDLAGGPTQGVVFVRDVSVYPVGTTVAVAVDRAGLRQLVAEPYDAGDWYLIAAVLALAGLGGWWRFVAQRHAQRRLLRRPQPAVTGYVRADGDHIYLYPGRFREASPPFAQLRVRDQLSTAGGPLRAVLYGTPAPGQWCTVRVGGVTLSPRSPIRVPNRQARRLVIGSAADPPPGTVPASPGPARVGPGAPSATSGRRSGGNPFRDLRAWLIASVVGAACVVGIWHRDRILAVSLDLLCAGGSCNPFVMVAAGWAPIGVPVLLLCAVLHIAEPGKVAHVAAAGCVVALGAAVALLTGDGASQLPAPFTAGFLVAFLTFHAVLIVASRAFSDGSRLLAVLAAGAELMALAGLLIWTAAG